MNKTTMAFAALLTAGLAMMSGTASAKTMEWSYADQVKTATRVGVSANDIVYFAFKIPQSKAKEFAGAKITEIHVIAGSDASNKNVVKKVFPFITSDLQAEEYEYKGEISMTTVAFGRNTQKLDQPYEIAGDKDLYVGYYFGVNATMANSYLLPLDGNKTAADIESCIFGYSKKLSDRPSEFMNVSDQIGSLCLYVTLEGDNLPGNIAQVSQGVFPKSIKKDKEFTTTLRVWNRGADDITKLTIKKQLGSTVSEEDVDLDEAIVPGDIGRVKIKATVSEDAINIIKFTITKVNGQENGSLKNSAATSVNFTDISQGFERRYLIEDATGTWCPWCTRGIAAMDYVKETYPDNFSCIGVHSGDDMEAESYQGFVSDYIKGFPTLLLDRKTELDITSEAKIKDTFAKLVEKLETEKAYAKVELKGVMNPAKTWIRLNTTTQFYYPSTAPHTLSFALIEDKVGPYVQQNNYAGGNYGNMFGWQDKGSRVAWTFDDVARDLVGYPGVENCMIWTAKPGEEYAGQQDISLASTTNPDNAYIYAIIVNDLTGEVINTTKIDQFEIADIPNAAVENVETEEISFRVVNGSIEAGDAVVAVYTLDGRQVVNTNLAKGIYVAVANGTAAKVLVK